MHHQKFRPPHGAHEKSSFTTQRAPYPHRGPRPVAVEPPKAMASALRVKNYRLLLSEVGEENLAVALDLTLHRIKELAEGLNFSNETTHHIETTLGLNSGFLDQVNPLLSASDIERIKAAPSTPSDDYVEDTPAAPISEAPAARPAASLEEASSYPHAQVNATPQNIVSMEPTVSQTALPVAEAATPALPVIDLAEQRRLNFQTLTARSGAKTAMARVTGLSPANISHRLHGNKIFDANEAAFFCEKLGLPADWFEAPRTEADVPAETYALLGLQNVASKPQGASKGPKGPRKPRVMAAPPLAPTQSEVGLSALARGKAPDPASSTTVSETTLSPGTPVPASESSRVLQARAQQTPPQVPAVTPSTASVDSQPILAPSGSSGISPFTAPALLSAEGQGVGPIAEALVRTLAAKSRAGALTEERALQLLVEIAAL